MKLNPRVKTAGLSTLAIILIVLLLVAVFGGYGLGGGIFYGPVGLLVIVLLILLATGRL